MGTDPNVTVVGITLPNAPPPPLVDGLILTIAENELNGPLTFGADGRDAEPTAVPVIEEPTGLHLRLGGIMREAVQQRSTPEYEEFVEEPRDPDTDHGKKNLTCIPEPTVVEVENLEPDEWEESSPFRVPPQESTSPELAAAITTMFGPPGPKELSVSSPVPPLPEKPASPSPSSISWTRAAGVATGLVFVVGIAVWKGGVPTDPIGSSSPTVSELFPDEPKPATVEQSAVVERPATEKEGMTPVPAVAKPPEVAKVVERPAVAVELPKVEPKVEPKVVAMVEPKPVVKQPAVVASSSTKIPASLVVSAMGTKPACVAECSWGDLTDKGFPKTVEGKRTIVCGEDSWLSASWTKIEAGDQKSCFTIKNLEDNPTGP